MKVRLMLNKTMGFKISEKKIGSMKYWFSLWANEMAFYRLHFYNHDTTVCDLVNYYFGIYFLLLDYIGYLKKEKIQVMHTVNVKQLPSSGEQR